MIGFLSPKGLALLKPMAIPLAFLAWTWVCFFSVAAFVAALNINVQSQVQVQVQAQVQVQVQV